MSGWLERERQSASGELPVSFYLNRSAHGATPERCSRLRSRLADQPPEGVNVTDYSESSRPLPAVLQDAAAGSRLLVVGGGDGTVACAVEAIRDTPCRLAVLPLGTMNVFARELGLPADPEAALQVVWHGECRRVDYGEVNGRVFLNGVILGQFSDLAEERERFRRGGMRSVPEVARASLDIVLQTRSHHYAMRSAEKSLNIYSRVVAVINNRLRAAPGDPFAREALDGAVLDVYASRDPSMFALPRMLMRMVLGRPQEDVTLAHWETQEVSIGTRRRRVKASVDGEVIRMKTPLVITVRAAGLPVLVPASSAAVSAAGGGERDTLPAGAA